MHPAAEGHRQHHHRTVRPADGGRDVEVVGQSRAGSPGSSTSSRTSTTRPAAAPPTRGSRRLLVPRAAGRGRPAAPPRRAAARSSDVARQLAAPAGAAAVARRPRPRRRRTGSAPPGRRAWQPARRRSRPPSSGPAAPSWPAAAPPRTRARSSGGVSGGRSGWFRSPSRIAGQQPVQLRPALELQAAHAARLIGGLRPPPGQLDQRRVAHQPGDRACRAAAPRARARRRSPPARPAARRAACPGPATRRQAWSGSWTTAAPGPNRRSISSAAQRQPAQPAEPLGQRVGGRQQVAHVVGGVLDLGRRQRALRPVGEALGVVQLDADALVQHALQRQRAAEPGEPGRQLDVEDRGRLDAEVQAEAGQVGRRARASRLSPRVGDQLGDRLQRGALERIDDGHAAPPWPAGRGTAGARRCAPRRTRCRARSAPRTGRSPAGRRAQARSVIRSMLHCGAA